MIRLSIVTGLFIAMLLVLPSGTHAQSKPVLLLEESRDNPDAAHLQVNSSEESEDYTVFVANIENHSDEDIVIEQITIDTTISGTVLTNAVIQEAILWVDGDEVAVSTIENKNDGNLVFKDLEFYIDANDDEEIELEVVFKKLDGNYTQGTTVRLDITPEDILAEDEDGVALSSSKISGSAASSVHTLSLIGMSIDPVSVNESLTTMDNGDQYGTYTIKFDVSVEGKDIYIPRTVSTSATSGVAYAIEGSPTFAGTQNTILTSTANQSGNYFVVEEGDAELFTLTLTANPNQSGSYKARLNEVRFADSAKSPNQSFALSDPDFATDPLTFTGTSTTSFKSTYRGYLNGKLFIETKNITEASALANCKLNAANNPKATVRCIWNDREIFNNSTAVVSATIKVTSPSATDNPMVTGTAKNTPRIGLLVSGGKYMDRIYNSRNIPVAADGTWSHKIPTDLADGTYEVSVHMPDVDPGTPLAVATLVVKTTTTTPTITVTAPNGGEKWTLKKTNSITWKPYSYDPDVNPSNQVTAYLETKNADGSFKVVGKVVENGKASIHWDGMVNSWNNFAKPGTNYYIRVVNDKTGVSDRSDAPFSLLTEEPAITVTAPNGGEKWQLKKLNTITWKPYSYNPDVNPSNQVTAYLEKKNADGSFEMIGKIIENGKASIHWDGMVGSWGSFATPGSGYYITVVNEKTGATDRSNAPFTITPADDVKASLSVTSPNGGESVVAGRATTVSWKQTGLNKMSVGLYKNDQWQSWIAKDMTAAAIEKGSLSWTPTNNSILDLGKVHKIYITGQKTDGTGYLDDKSDAAFSIIPLPATALSCRASADRTLVRPLEKVTLSWSSTGADYVTLAGERAAYLSGSTNVNPATTTMYTFIAHRGVEQKKCVVGVKVIADEPLIQPGVETPQVLPSVPTTKEPSTSSFDQMNTLSASALSGYESIRLQLESVLKSLRALKGN